MNEIITQRVRRAREQFREANPKNNKPETEFEKSLIHIAPLYGCLYIKIPDFINAPVNKIIAHKRPFDGIICTPNQNYCIECKINYGKQKEHQVETEKKINSINNSYYLLRKKIYAKNGKIEYIVEQNMEKLFKTNDITKLFEFFKDPNNSQLLMFDSILPHTKRKFKRSVRG